MKHIARVNFVISSWKGINRQKVGYHFMIDCKDNTSGKEYNLVYHEFISRKKKVTDLNVASYFEMETKNKFKNTQYCDIVYKFFENNKEWYKEKNLGKPYIVN